MSLDIEKIARIAAARAGFAFILELNADVAVSSLDLERAEAHRDALAAQYVPFIKTATRDLGHIFEMRPPGSWSSLSDSQLRALTLGLAESYAWRDRSVNEWGVRREALSHRPALAQRGPVVPGAAERLFARASLCFSVDEMATFSRVVEANARLLRENRGELRESIATAQIGFSEQSKRPGVFESGTFLARAGTPRQRYEALAFEIPPLESALLYLKDIGAETYSLSSGTATSSQQSIGTTDRATFRASDGPKAPAAGFVRRVLDALNPGTSGRNPG